MAMPSMMDKLKSKEKELAQDYQRSYDTKDAGGSFKNIWVDELPFPRLKIKNGQHLLDIIPYLCGPNDPSHSEGTMVSYLDILVHGGIGPNSDMYICMDQYKKRCAVCEEIRHMKDNDADEEDIKRIGAKRRGIYFVISYDEGEEKKGIQIMDLSHYLFQNNLIAQAKQPDQIAHKTGAWINYAGIEDGKRIFFTHTGTKVKTRIEGIKFYDRDYTFPESVFEKVLKHPLDTLLRFPNYDELKSYLLQLREMGAMVETATRETAPNPQEAAGQKLTQQYTNPCPANQTFGASFGSGAACLSCSVKDECVMEKAKTVQDGFKGSSKLQRGETTLPEEDIPF